MTPLEALQSTLAGEHAASYVFAVLAAQTSQSGQPEFYRMLKRSHDVHRAQRDQLTLIIRHAGADPVAAEAAYVLPNPVASPAQVRAAARLTESRCVDLYGQLVENSTGADRGWAIKALIAGSLRLRRLGARPENFPGMTAD